MGLLISLPVTLIYGVVSFIFEQLVAILYKIPEWIKSLSNTFYHVLTSIPESLQAKSVAFKNFINKAIEKTSPYIKKAASLLSFNNGPWLLRLPGEILSFSLTAIRLFLTSFANAIPTLNWWIGLIVFYWLIVWILLPATIDPGELVLITNSITEGLKAVANGFTAIINLIFDFLDWVKVPFNLLISFIFTCFQYLSEYLLGDLGFDRLGNLKSVTRLKNDFAGFQSGLNNDQKQFSGRRELIQDTFGADSTFGGFTLNLKGDSPAVKGFARFYSSVFSSIGFALDILTLLWEIWLALIAPSTTQFIQAFIGIFTNLSCLISACKDANGIGCTILEFFVIIINTIIKIFGAKPVEGCKASSFPNVPCYCSRSEGGFYQSLPSCPVPLYTCVNKAGEFTEIKIEDYNGNRIETILTSGPTREIGCPKSLRSGRMLSIGKDCRDICHIDDSGEGWWVNVCDTTNTLKGHCVAPLNQTVNTIFEELHGEVHARHLRRYLKKPWLSRKEKRLLTTIPSFTPNTIEQTTYDQFIHHVADAYKNMPNVRDSPLDCSKVNPYNFESIHSILYNSVCVSLSVYDLLDKNNKIKSISEQFDDAFPPKKSNTAHFGRNLKESSASGTTLLEYIYRNMSSDFTWDNYKKLHIEYIDHLTEGEYKSRLSNPPYMYHLNKTAHLLMSIHRSILDTPKPEQQQRRNLQQVDLLNIPRSTRTYICPGSNQRVYQRISVDPLTPGLESCKFPQKWDTSTILQYISFILLFTFYTFNPATLFTVFTDCWGVYTDNPETYPLTYEGINAMIYNDNAYLDTKTFCFPLYRGVPRIPSIVWSFLTWVEESCGTEYTIENGQINRCICPMYVISEVLDDTASQWIAFIPLFVKYRMINSYRTLQIIWTLFIPIEISNVWTNILLLIYPSTPKEVLYIFNQGYAQGNAVYWGTNNDLTPIGITGCVILTIQSPFYFVIWFIFPLYYFTFYIPFITYLLQGTVTNRIHHSIAYFFNYINLRRAIQQNPTISIWGQRMRENPFFAMLKYVYSKIIVPCGRDLCPRRVSSSWCPPRPEWETSRTTNTNAVEYSSLEQSLLLESLGQPQSQLAIDMTMSPKREWMRQRPLNSNKKNAIQKI